MKAHYKKHILKFKRPSGTSRGVMQQKETWFIILEENGVYGIGECGMLRDLSIDDVPLYEEKLRWTCDNIKWGKDKLWGELIQFPSIQFGVEQAFLSFNADNPFELFHSPFTETERSIPINGLIWMGDEGFMYEQIQQKLEEGYKCIKIKIGAIDFETEIKLLKDFRKRFSKKEIELRVDANGAFSPEEALEKLRILSSFNIHSIEQPIKQGNMLPMKMLCSETPLPIALDEELIGVFGVTEKEKLLQTVQPQYIVIKPSLVGGYRGSEEWIEIAKKHNIGWWITSALESNIGLNAISQWTYGLKNALPQGLGTGSLFTNNFESPLTVEKGYICYNRSRKWKTNLIQELCI